MNKENNIILGILFMTLAMFCLSVNDVLVKGLSFLERLAVLLYQ